MPGDSPTVKAPARFDEAISLAKALSMDKAIELAQSNKSIADWELRKIKFIRQVKQAMLNSKGGVVDAFPEVRI